MVSDVAHSALQFFHQLVAHDKKIVQGHLQDFLLGPGLHVTARRNHIYQDAFSELARGASMLCASAGRCRCVMVC